jgi:methylthioribose-1-phosphate isomerase
MTSLESLKYSRGQLKVIDQLKLPSLLEYIDINTTEDAWKAIKTMQVRGAPLIAIVAALGLAVHVEKQRSTFQDVRSAVDFLLSQMEYLRSSRPTAVNLFQATDHLSLVVREASENIEASSTTVIDAFIHAAEQMLQDDITTNKSIGHHGASRLLEIAGSKPLRVLTICNTGSLATAGYGTALGVIRSLHAQGFLQHVYACETRP